MTVSSKQRPSSPMGLLGIILAVLLTAAACGTWAQPPRPDPPAGARFTLTDEISVSRGAPESSELVDLTGDGRLDLVVAANDTFYSAIRSPAPGISFDVGTESPSDGNPIKGFGLQDFDQDGRLDPFLTRGGITGSGEAGRNLGNGQLTFSNLGNDVEVNSRTALFDDFDRDGHVDSLHLGSAFRENHAWNELHAGSTGGRFSSTNSIDTAMPAPFWHQRVTAPGSPCDGEEWSNQQSKGGVIRDFDRDGRPDVMLVAYTDLGFPDTRCSLEHRTFTLNHGYRGVFLLRNVSTPGHIRFADMSKAALGPNAYCNSPTPGCDQYYAPVPFDIDRDGDLDVVLGGLVPPLGGNTALMRLFRNDSTPGITKFTDITATSGAFQTLNQLSQTAKDNYRFSEGAPVDVDGDGWLDLAFTNRQDSGEDKGVGYIHVFRNLGHGRFQLLDRGVSGIPHYANALVPSDLDRDGDADLVISDKFFTGKTYIYRNNTNDTAHGVTINVKDKTTRTWLIGAKVSIYGPDNVRVAMDEVRTDFSYRSKRTPAITAIVPGAKTVNVRIVDRAGHTHSYTGLANGTTHELLIG